MTVNTGETFSQMRTLTKKEIAAFATASGDTNPLHHDAAFAEKSVFGRIIASGTHTTALLLGLVAAHFAARGTVVGLEFSVRFARPVYADEAVTVLWTVACVVPAKRGQGDVLELEGSLRDSQDRVCVWAKGKVLVGSRLGR